MSTTTTRYFFIRPALLDDIQALSKICLLTANAGQSAETLHNYPELLGSHYIDPYVLISPAFGFVLVSCASEEEHKVVGYLLGTPDTRSHEAVAESTCYPPLRVKYPNHPYPPNSTGHDHRVINRIHYPLIRPQGLVDLVPAHVHINILPEAQGQGWGALLINKAVEYLKGLGKSGLFVGIDSRNHNARAFYQHIGFKPYPFPEKEYLVLDFKDWKAPLRRGTEKEPVE